MKITLSVGSVYQTLPPRKSQYNIQNNNLKLKKIAVVQYRCYVVSLKVWELVYVK